MVTVVDAIIAFSDRYKKFTIWEIREGCRPQPPPSSHFCGYFATVENDQLNQIIHQGKAEGRS